MLRIASISDIHLNHRRTKTEFIIQNLNTYFSNDEFLSQVDLLVFVGDVFDDLISMSNEDVSLIQSWIAKCLRLCARYNVCVRVLEGTPSHDRNQSNTFVTINEIHAKNGASEVDLKYVKTLSIEHITRFGIDVLYVPDEWNHDTADTLVEVKTLLKTKGLTQVDYTFLHGCFNYQIPEITKQNIKHNEPDYLALTKHLIFVGHVHKHSRFERIYSNGSFDRLAQNEEEAKGFLYAIVDGSDYTVKFIVNKTAKRYVSIKSYHDDLADSLKMIDKKVANLPNGSYVRVETSYLNPISGGVDTLKVRWPLFNWSVEIKEKGNTEKITSLVDDVVYTPIIINKETLYNLVIDRLAPFNLHPEILERAKLHLADMEIL